MDFWACAEEVDRLWRGPGEKHSTGVTRCYRGAKGSRVNVLACLAAESLAKLFLSSCLIFPIQIIKIPIPFKNEPGGEIYIKNHIKFHPFHLRMSLALCSQAEF